MTALALSWFEDDDPRDLKRWAAAAAIVLGIHVAAIAGYVLVRSPDEIGDESSIVSVELAPIESTANVDERNVAPGPDEMVEQKELPDVQKQPEQPKIEEPPPPDTTMSDVAQPVQKPPEKVEEQRPPAPRTASKVRGGAPLVAPSWETLLVRRLHQLKKYPNEARDHDEKGTVTIRFVVDHTGHVLSSQILQSSGYLPLDNEGISLIKRLEPLPPFPPEMPQDQIVLTVPISFQLE